MATKKKTKPDAPPPYVARATAITHGWIFYCQQTECPRGHISWRYTTSGGCLECQPYYRSLPRTIACKRAYYQKHATRQEDQRRERRRLARLARQQAAAEIRPSVTEARP
jgi:hypothetical protein